MKLRTAAALVDNAVRETFTFYAYPPQHRLKIKTNNPMERLLKEARRRTKVGRGVSGQPCGLDAGVCPVTACLSNQMGHP